MAPAMKRGEIRQISPTWRYATYWKLVAPAAAS